MASLTASSTDATEKRLDVDPGYDAEAMRLVDVLRSRRGTRLTITPPSYGTGLELDLETVVLNCAATGWADQVFGGPTLAAALGAANDFVEHAQAETLAAAPTDQAGHDKLLAVELEVDAFRRIAVHTVRERRRQIAAGRDAANDDQHTRGELSKFARLLVMYGNVVNESGAQALTKSIVATNGRWWEREAVHHALKFAGDMPALLVHAATALLAEAARLERRAKFVGQCRCAKRHLVDQDDAGAKRWAEVGDLATVEFIGSNADNPYSVGFERTGASGFYTAAEMSTHFTGIAVERREA